jgi:hypothetical protein
MIQSLESAVLRGLVFSATVVVTTTSNGWHIASTCGEFQANILKPHASRIANPAKFAV